MTQTPIPEKRHPPGPAAPPRSPGTASGEGRREITRLLESWNDGDEDARQHLISIVYGELRTMAQRYLVKERRDHTLQPTALVHEAYLRLIKQDRLSWQGRSHFFGIAATLMRRILVDHARGRNYAKRGGGVMKISLDEQGEIGEGLATDRDLDLVALDDALTDLSKLDAEKATLVELRYFAGLSLEETAEVLGTSRATVIRQWRVARAWLYRQLAADATPQASVS